MGTLPNTSFSFEDAIRNVPHDERWDILRPELEVLFHSNETYATIGQHMKTKYGFDAQISAYKYRFKKWAWKRSIPSHKKDQILHHTQQRAVLGKRTASASFGNTIVDPRKLRRYVASTNNKSLSLSSFNHQSDVQLHSLGVYLPFGVRPFTIWAAPFGGAFSSTKLSAVSPLSNNMQITTPSEVDFRTPSDSRSPPVTSPAGPPSPFSAAVLAHASINRAKLFTQGKLVELVQTMNHSQQRTMSEWLYQFWLFGFKTAKSWGPDFRQWNASNLEFAKYQPTLSDMIAETRSANALSPFQSQSTGASLDLVPAPSDLCRWSIHIDEDAMYADIGTDISVAGETDERRQLQQQSMDQFLSDGLQSNEFSTISADQMPINFNLITQAARSSPQVLLEETLSFTIMAQNYEALEQMCDEHPYKDVQRALEEIFAMHIATSYLNGGKMCCNILALICRQLECRNTKDYYTNDYGHTVLDNLMLTILKCHSTAAVHDVDTTLKRGTRFTGIEADICGRWDADSPCFRSLIATGATSIPHHWKHKFCNTSVQVICHCIVVLAQWHSLNVPSGLFQKLCTRCGMKLQLRPLHCLVMVSYMLAKNACTGEDLFGIIACFLCLLSVGIDPLESAHISVSAVIGLEDGSEHCGHRAMTPYDLITELSGFGNDSWAAEVRIGWTILSEISRRAGIRHGGLEDASDHSNDDEMENASECGDYEETHGRMRKHFGADCVIEMCIDRMPDYENAFGTDLMLGHLWAAAQAEFLNYRRLSDNDRWLSENFDMFDLACQFEHDNIPKTGYIRKGMLREYCRCGRFGYDMVPLRESVSKEGLYFANMDCWERSSFIAHTTLLE